MKRKVFLGTVMMTAFVQAGGAGKDDTRDVVAALKSVEKREEAATKIIREREKRIHALIRLVKRKVDVSSPRGTMETAVRLLGALRAKEAVPVLIENIDYRPWVEDEFRGDVLPCVDALIEIGCPAARAIWDKHLASATGKRLPLYAKVLKGVWGEKICILLLRARLENERLGPKERGILQAVLSHIGGDAAGKVR